MGVARAELDLRHLLLDLRELLPHDDRVDLVALDVMVGEDDHLVRARLGEPAPDRAAAASRSPAGRSRSPSGAPRGAGGAPEGRRTPPARSERSPRRRSPSGRGPSGVTISSSILFARPVSKVAMAVRTRSASAPSPWPPRCRRPCRTPAPGASSSLPLTIWSKPSIVFSRSTNFPSLPVNCLGDVERLREEALDLAGAGDDELVVLAELVHAEDGNDVEQILVLLEGLLHPPGDVVVALPEDVGVDHRRGRVERVDGRVDADLGEGAGEHRGRVEVGEGRRGGRVGEVVGGDVDGLDAGDRARGSSR